MDALNFQQCRWRKRKISRGAVLIQVEIAQKKNQLIGKETFDNVRGSIMSMICCATGRTAEGLDAAISPISNDERRAALER